MNEGSVMRNTRLRLTVAFAAMLVGCEELDQYVNRQVPVASQATGVLAPSDGRDYSALKIAPPPRGGIYLGQYEWQSGDIRTFEDAIGRRIAWWSTHAVMEFTPHPRFNAEAAEHAWGEGKVVRVEAYEAYPNPDNDHYVKGFTVDKLLQGQYEEQLRRLAAQFRAFGKPMFFGTAREPNGISSDYFGGFGPEGDQSLRWAIEHHRGFEEFDPSRFPSAQLYAGLGDPRVSDGVERLAAAQRYYYDFFVHREGLTFLTFDTMGWATVGAGGVQHKLEDLEESGGQLDREYARKLLASSLDFANFYPGDAAADWVSINWYAIDFYAADWAALGLKLEEDIIVPVDVYLERLASTMEEVRRAAPGKPVLFLEFGVPDGKKRDSAWAAEKLTKALRQILQRYPEIHGLSMWSAHPSWAKIFPYDCLIRPGTRQARAFRELLADQPSRFHSCVYLSDGRPLPTCS